MLPEMLATIDSHLRPPAIGRVFYVNHFTGLNTNNGIDPGTPFQTITYALTQCVDGRNDYILVEDCWNVEPAFPIVVNKTRVHIIGLGHGTMMPVYFPSITGGGVGAIFQLAGCHFSEIAGFDMQSAGQACIEMIAPLVATNVWIHHCTFGMSGAAQDGILALPPANNDDPNFSIIEHCMFGWQLTRHGIWLSSPTKTTIRNNVFNSLAGGRGINLGTGAAGVGIVGDIIGNYFFAPIALALARGWAITIQNGGAIIMGNRASQTGNDTGTNPYCDLSTGVLITCLNGWADNFDGQALSVGPDVV